MSYFLFFLLLLLYKSSEKPDQKNEKRNLQSTISIESEDYNNIRIRVDTDCLKLVSTDKKDIIKESINKAIETIGKLVKVKTLKNGINYRGYGITKPSDISSYLDVNKDLYNIEADLVIFVRDSTTGLDGTTDYGLPEIKVYLNNDQNNRPIIGVIGYYWNDEIENLASYDSRREVIYSHFLHQITHILGFNKTILFNKGLISQRSQKMRMNSNSQNKYFYKGKNVIERARKYYNYPSLTELEMDDTNGKEPFY